MGQLCFPISQRLKVNDTEHEHKRKEKSMAVKQKYAFSNLEIHVQASYATDKDAEWTACWELKRRCQPSDCLLVHLKKGDWVIRGQVADPASVEGIPCLSVITPHFPSWAEAGGAGGNSRLCQGDCTGYGFRHLFPTWIKTLQSNTMDF